MHHRSLKWAQAWSLHPLTDPSQKDMRCAKLYPISLAYASSCMHVCLCALGCVHCTVCLLTWGLSICMFASLFILLWPGFPRFPVSLFGRCHFPPVLFFLSGVRCSVILGFEFCYDVVPVFQESRIICFVQGIRFSARFGFHAFVLRSGRLVFHDAKGHLCIHLRLGIWPIPRFRFFHDLLMPVSTYV